LEQVEQREGLNRITKIKSFGASRAEGLNRITKIKSFGASRTEGLNRITDDIILVILFRPSVLLAPNDFIFSYPV
jgi:hypothetical protein